MNAAFYALKPSCKALLRPRYNELSKSAALDSGGNRLVSSLVTLATELLARQPPRPPFPGASTFIPTSQTHLRTSSNSKGLLGPNQAVLFPFDHTQPPWSSPTRDNFTDLLSLVSIDLDQSLSGFLSSFVYLAHQL